MASIDHGKWQIYKPEQLPVDAPPNAIFSRRVSDGVDWYDYVNAGTNFAPNTTKMTVYNNIVAAATIDATALFPGGVNVIETDEAVTGSPQAFFGRKIYDPATKAFSDPPPLEPPLDKALLDRVAALEAKVNAK